MIKTKAFVFDFDDTLAFTDAKVRVVDSFDFHVATLTPQEFNSVKLEDGQRFDFSDFDKSSLILNGTPTKLIQLAKDVFSEGHSVFILTARANQASSAIAEWRKSKSNTSIKPQEINSLKERMGRSMQVTFNKESEIIEKNLTFLATAGSTAPFIGLFGTVWGIMNSFKSIAIAQNTNLAVVAPGIAEALFATALGLFVAIPAVVAYNKITSDLSKYFISLETFMDEFTTIFFRQLENK